MNICHFSFHEFFHCHVIEIKKKNFQLAELSEINHRISSPLDKVRKSIDRNGICIKGVISIPDTSLDGDLQNLNQKFRNALDLYAHKINVKSLSGVNSKHKDLDFVIIRGKL